MCYLSSQIPNLLRFIFLFLITIFLGCRLWAVPATDSTQTYLKIRNILLEGNKKTRNYIIYRELMVHAGDSIPLQSLSATLLRNKQRIQNLQLFTDVVLSLQNWRKDSADIHIKVSERWYIFPQVFLKLADRNFNVWWVDQHHSLDRINVGLMLSHDNFTGMSDVASIGAQLGYTRKFSTSYYIPYLDRKLKHGMGAGFYYAINREINYFTDLNKQKFVRLDSTWATTDWGADLFYTYRPRYNAKHTLSIGYNYKDIGTEVQNLNPQYFPNGVTKINYPELYYRFDFDNTDSKQYPLRGYRIWLMLLNRGLGVNNNVNQTYIHNYTGAFIPLTKKWYTSFIFRGRLSFPENQSYVFSRAMGYGYDYIRGFEYYVIDGSHFGILKSNVKYKLLDFRIPVPWLPFINNIPFKAFAKTYADIGYGRNVNPGNSFLNNRMLAGYGVGLDVVTLYDLNIRMEYTFNNIGQKGLFLQFISE